MNILCVNTAFNQTYVALKNDKGVVYKQMDSSLKQSENILGAVDQVLQQAKNSLNEIETFACVIGPGSFTGIRIGASLLKGFCAGLDDRNKIAVSSLDLLAYTFVQDRKPNQDFWVVLNALSGNLFACKYNNMGKKLQQEILVTGEEINNIQGIVVGLKDEALDLCNQYEEFSCQSLLDYCLLQLEKQNFVDDFVPLYLRKSQAEAELEKRNQTNGN